MPLGLQVHQIFKPVEVVTTVKSTLPCCEWQQAIVVSKLDVTTQDLQWFNSLSVHNMKAASALPDTQNQAY